MADSIERFTWTNFYMELANKLLPYRDNRDGLIDAIESVYASIDLKFPRLDSEDRPVDIDQYTVYGLFNKGISDANRKKIIIAITDAFGIEADVPSDFDGIPVLKQPQRHLLRVRG